MKNLISGIICLISGIALSIVGLYYFHMQYLCYEYTPLLFILAVVVCLGGGFLSLPIGKSTDKKKAFLRFACTALVFAAVLIGLMFLINGIIGNGELNQTALIVPVYLTFIITALLVFLCIIKIFDKKILKAILSLIILSGFAIGSYSYIRPYIIEEI